MRMVSSFQPKKDTSEAFVLFDGQIIRNKMVGKNYFLKFCHILQISAL